jgi:hypothetical protein
MTNERAEKLAAEFVASDGYRVEAKPHGLLVTESEGRTSFFVEEENFFRFVEGVAARLNPIR